MNTGTFSDGSSAGLGMITHTQYDNIFIFKYTGTSTPELTFFLQPEGYIEPDNQGDYDYVYQFKDHLGNVRLTYSDSNNDGSINPATEIISEKNYYPFGLKHKGYNNVVDGTYYPYGYNGKELVDNFGLSLIEMDWRQYDPVLGRFNVTDPLAEEMFDQTPYHFAFNNPIYFKDPTGLNPEYDSYDYYEDMGNQQEAQEQEAQNNCCPGETIMDGKTINPLPEVLVVEDSERVSELKDLGYSYYDIEFRDHLRENNHYYYRILLGQEDRGIYRRLQIADKGYWSETKRNYNRGWKNWDKDGLGNFLMNATAIGVGGAMTAPVASVFETSIGFMGLGNMALEGYASVQAYGSYYYIWTNLTLNRKITTFATGSVISLGKAIGPKYVKIAPRPLIKYLGTKNVHSFFRKPTINTNIDFIKPIINGLYGKTGAPYFDRPFGR
ncbi:RHS repeat domain-containing protein [Psychroflexus halocasei]|uniref:RHS repeat-associated core domain-containing protein n=1 Tax=Psychroflexus halocasei TaxID=908615 RepID=A0A1H4E5S7_9FLAO|nr:RHS repeat-associated core domain-containing protein [Psychroflexus halocasei]SEA80381.1 RHS repeat-associated core domain-containing protein [Psychroflexus halocasei]